MNAEEAPNDLGTAAQGGMSSAHVKTIPANKLLERKVTESIIGGFYEVYNTFGFGLLEKAYAESLAFELELRGHDVRREVPTQIFYKGKLVALYKIDLVVDDRVVLEVKSTQRLNREDPRQLLNYLRATHWEIGLLLHFGPEPAFHRFVSTNTDPRKGATQEQRVPLPRSSA
jgi:GxxExxY protein